MAEVEVAVKFEATAERRALFHQGKPVELDEDGEGTLMATLDEDDAILAEVRGAEPGSAVKITLEAEDPAKVEMVPFVDNVAGTRTVWADSRFFRVTT